MTENFICQVKFLITGSTGTTSICELSKTVFKEGSVPFHVIQIANSFGFGNSTRLNSRPISLACVFSHKMQPAVDSF